MVVNLAGTPTAGNPHSAKWARELRESRVRTTATLAVGDRGAATGGRRSWPATASATTATTATRSPTEESDSRGDALFTSVCRDWQAAAEPAADAGARVCVLRTSPVMDRRSDRSSSCGCCSRPGWAPGSATARQYMPIVSLRDWTGGVAHLAEHETASGPFNLVCPHPPTNAEFTDELARQLVAAVLRGRPKAADQARRGPDGRRAPGLGQRPSGRPRGRRLRVPGPRRRRRAARGSQLELRTDQAAIGTSLDGLAAAIEPLSRRRQSPRRTRPATLRPRRSTGVLATVVHGRRAAGHSRRRPGR